MFCCLRSTAQAAISPYQCFYGSQFPLILSLRPHTDTCSAFVTQHLGRSPSDKVTGQQEGRCLPLGGAA